ncbi:hypothetical protein [Pseudoteredinibacter isoporae]|uniref:Transmembrane protein n=1 Tax=Pseudoteredinibacter isoporae TaxID=570281 RepID=A0A7X0JV03_9GAMM|nr:hypothetical protein [Pseudoteredinibacter isoporae]MBB6521891.1 hypothetical protein [Pseudoteredinibacter isoporae]NHO87435.1 hypothetical protein [Pseudoteredinibacter isoporae]NIB24234.1 hypothetical protein [Pseudoteredinibacter isoporae]
MYRQLWMPKDIHESNEIRAHQWALILGNWIMLVATGSILVSVVLSYGFEQSLSIATLIFWHTTTVICAGLLKIGYLLRCIALKFFGSRDF